MRQGEAVVVTAFPSTSSVLDLLARRRYHVPLRSEIVGALARRLTGGRVSGISIKRMVRIGDLHRAVRASGRAEKRRLDTCGRGRLPGRQKRRPVLGALPVARALPALVLLEQVERSALRVDQDLAERRAV